MTSAGRGIMLTFFHQSWRMHSGRNAGTPFLLRIHKDSCLSIICPMQRHLQPRRPHKLKKEAFACCNSTSRVSLQMFYKYDKQLVFRFPFRLFHQYSRIGKVSRVTHEMNECRLKGSKMDIAYNKITAIGFRRVTDVNALPPSSVD